MVGFFGRSPTKEAASIEMQQHLQLVRGYWEALRRGPFLPKRQDLDPKGLASVLDRVFVVERVAKGHARFRISGMHLHDILGMDARGMPLGTLFEPVARARLADELEEVFQSSAVLDIHLEAERALGKPALTGRMLLLPLVGDADEQTLALGCLSTHGLVGRQPRRFAISRVKREDLTAPKLSIVAQNDAPEVIADPHIRSEAPPALRLVSSRD